MAWFGIPTYKKQAPPAKMAAKKYSCSAVDSADTYGRMILSRDKTPTDPKTKKFGLAP